MLNRLLFIVICLIGVFSQAIRAKDAKSKDADPDLSFLEAGNGPRECSYWFAKRFKDWDVPVPTGTFVATKSIPAGHKVWGVHTCKGDKCGIEYLARPFTKEDEIIKKGEIACPNCGLVPDAKDAKLTYSHVPRGHVDKIQLIDPSIKTAEPGAIVTNVDEYAGTGKQWRCEICSISIYSNISHCNGCGALNPKIANEFSDYATEHLNKLRKLNGKDPIPTDVVREHSGEILETAKNLPKDKLKKILKIGGSVSAGLGAVGILYWGFSTNTVQGEITNTQWTHTETIETYVPVRRSDWEKNVHYSNPVMPINGRGEYPGKFDISNRRREISGYEKVLDHYEKRSRQVVTGSKQVFDGNEMVANGDGSFTSKPTYRTENTYGTEYYDEPIYRDEPIYEFKVDYSTYEWQFKDREQTSGQNATTTNLPWPNLSTGPRDRKITSTNYKANYTYKKGKKIKSGDIHLNSSQDLLKFQPGTAIQAKVRNFGGTAGVEILDSTMNRNVEP